MSSYLYGTLTQRRQQTPSNAELVYDEVPATAPGSTPGEPARPSDPVKDKVRHLQDGILALVPGEVLALHGIAMSFGTTTTGSGDDVVTRITHPGQMMVVYVGMVLLAAGLYFLGAKSFKAEDWVRALIPAAAFVIWTMIQPSTAFDAFPFALNSFARIMLAVFGAVLLGLLVNFMASRADKE